MERDSARRRVVRAILACLTLLAASRLSAQEWPRFRGPDGAGLSDAKTIPVKWTREDLNWKRKLPGPGHSQPVVWGERLFVTSASDDGAARLLLCVSTEDGATRWQRDCRLSANRKHELNSFASSTPVVDEGRVYVTFADEEELLVQALDHDGEHAWRSVFPGFKGRHGHAASPITHGNRLFVANEAQEASFVLALDKDTGKVVWKSPRRSDRGAYGTPCVVTAPEGGAELILTSKGHGISSLDLETGALRWEAPLFDKRSVSSPVIYKDLVIGTCGSGAGGNYLAAVRRGGSGDVSETHLAYKLSRSIPYVPTALVYDDLLFLWSDKGVVTCVKAATGDTVWMNRVEGRYFGSPVCVDGKLYCMSADGEVVVVRAADSFELLARNELGEPSHSTPAIAGGRMYLRTERHLSSVGGRRAQP